MTFDSRSPTPENDVFSSSVVEDRAIKSAGTTTTNFDGLLQSPLLLYEDLKEGCGGQLWPAGRALTKYMLTYHRNLKNKSVVELGAGGGLVGLAVAKGCELDEDKKLLITDQIPMLALMQKNIEFNHLQDRVAAAVYDWGTAIPNETSEMLLLDITRPYPDVILAADCVYFEPAFPLLLQTLSDLIGPETVCYFCFKKRRKADMRFIKAMKKKFQVQEIEYHDREVDRKDGIFLYTLVSRLT